MIGLKTIVLMVWSKLLSLVMHSKIISREVIWGHRNTSIELGYKEMVHLSMKVMIYLSH